MKILLTGASGFIGSLLLRELVEDGHQVTCISRRSIGANNITGEFIDWPELVCGKQFDICIHLAWIATPGVYLQSPENNALAEISLNFAQSLFESGLKHFVGIGSCIEYAPELTEACVEDSSPVRPISAYAKAKCKLHTGLQGLAEKSGARLTWARIFYPYGIGEHPARTATTFLCKLGSGEKLELKTPDSIKDFIELNDIVFALKFLATHEQAQGVFNIGTGIGTRIQDLAILAAKTIGADISNIREHEDEVHDPYAYHIACINKLRGLGWLPTIDLKQGIKQLALSLK